VVFVIPNEKERLKVQESCGEDSHIVFITTPGQVCLQLRFFYFSLVNFVRFNFSFFGYINAHHECAMMGCPTELEIAVIDLCIGWGIEQLTALISDSSGVVTTNTVALQLAIAMKKPT